MSDKSRVFVTVDVRPYMEALDRMARALANVHPLVQRRHADGAYAEVMLREHLQALARQGLTRNGAPHV